MGYTPPANTPTPTPTPTPGTGQASTGTGSQPGGGANHGNPSQPHAPATASGNGKGSMLRQVGQFGDNPAGQQLDRIAGDAIAKTGTMDRQDAQAMAAIARNTAQAAGGDVAAGIRAGALAIDQAQRKTRSKARAFIGEDPNGQGTWRPGDNPNTDTPPSTGQDQGAATGGPTADTTAASGSGKDDGQAGASLAGIAGAGAVGTAGAAGMHMAQTGDKARETVAILAETAAQTASTALTPLQQAASWLHAARNWCANAVHSTGAFMSSAWQGAASMATTAWHAVSGFASSLVATPAAAVTTVTATITATATIATLLTAGTTRYDDGSDTITCVSSVEQAASSTTSGSQADQEGQQLQTARDIAEVLAYLGMGHEQIAGILSNLQAESGLDPTTIEGIYDEPYDANGAKHQQALNDPDTWVTVTLRNLYGGSQNSMDGYRDASGKHWPGIGLAQWTPGSKLLNAAQQFGMDWADPAFQIAYMATSSSPTGLLGGADWPSTYMRETQGKSAEECARTFTQWLHGNPASAFIASHVEHADQWDATVSSWRLDGQGADTILASISTSLDKAASTSLANAVNACQSQASLTGDNSTIASAAVSYAWATQAQGLGNQGTELYQALMKAIFPGDTNYMSCDRGVAVAIRWAGYDDDYPAGDTGQQLAYLQASTKWEQVGTLKGLGLDGLQPGDVLILDGHTFLYTGEDAVQAVHPGSDGNSVSASYQERSPGVGRDAFEYLRNPDPRGDYQAYRCIQPDHSDTYRYVVASTTMSAGATTIAIDQATIGVNNPYPYGQCTWYAWGRRNQLGKPLPTASLGNAKDWANSARSHGYTVDHTPGAGSVIVFSPGQAGADSTYGHVAIVESVNKDGTVTISESNVQGLGVISTRTLAASQAIACQYIH